MAISPEKIRTVIQDSITEVVENNNGSMKEVTVNDELKLFSEGAIFDSIGFVNFIMTLEQNFRELGYEINLLDEKAFSMKNSPFSNVGKIDQYIQEKMSVYE